MDDANQELVEEYLSSWTETHKKSALLYVILAILKDQPMWARDIQNKINDITGWDTTERGLYRSLQRMEKQGLLEHVKQNANRTGADRKIYKITALGQSLFIEITNETKYLQKIADVDVRS
jgi:PadR family transcriptional regulator, regulatory protein PadR